jgi:hypothetical protein
MRNLQQWVDHGVLPPRESQPFVTDATGKAILDQYGNYQGGVRLPAVDVPVATLFTQGTNCFLWGYKVAFTPQLLKQLYPTHKAYVKQVSRKVQDLVAEGWLTEANGKELIIAADASSNPDADRCIADTDPPVLGPRPARRVGRTQGRWRTLERRKTALPAHHQQPAPRLSRDAFFIDGPMP